MVDQTKARATLEKILKSREYTVYENHSKGFFQTWWENAKEWLANQLEKLFPTFASAKSASGVILIIMIVIVVILLLFSAFFIIRNIKRNQQIRKQKPLQTLIERNWTYVQHLEEANKREAAGDYSSSTRHLFLALLLFFQEQKWIEMKIWKTNWDYYHELSRIHSEYAERFYELASFFDMVTYGESFVQQEDYLSYRALVTNWMNIAKPVRELLSEGGQTP